MSHFVRLAHSDLLAFTLYFSFAEVVIQQKNKPPYNGYIQSYGSLFLIRRSMSCLKMVKSYAGKTYVLVLPVVQ